MSVPATKTNGFCACVERTGYQPILFDTIINIMKRSQWLLAYQRDINKICIL